MVHIARILLIVIKACILLGEGTVWLVTTLARLIGAHLKVMYYIARFVIGSVISLPIRLVRRVRTGASSLMRVMSRALHSTSQRVRMIPHTVLNAVRERRQSIQSSLRQVREWILSRVSILKTLNRPRIRLDTLRRDKSSVIVAQDLANRQRARSVRVKYIRLTVLTICVLLCTFAVSGYFVMRFYRSLPRPQDIGTVNYALSSHVFDRNGRPLYDFYKDQQRTPIKLSELPEYVAQSAIAIEDKDFYKHNGVSLVGGIVRALKEMFVLKKGLQGGSTITQQLVKTALLTPERTIIRKIKEIIIALETERVFSKSKILEMYLNQVPYGGSVYGIEEASRKFFGKSARDVTLAEAALLAGLPQAPTIYSPFSNISAAVARRDRVLDEMRIQGFITPDQYESAKAEPAKILDDTISIQAPHFVFYVRNYLEKTLQTNDLYQGGYLIHTTLDLDIQQEAERILNEEIEKIRYLSVTNGAMLVTRPSTGEILAMVGSVNYFDGTSGEYNVTTALRQPGSSIKPLLYAHALARGYTAATLIDDTPAVFQIPGAETYRPVNYDGRFHGRVTVRQALANSYNVPAVKVLQSVGVPDFMQFAKDAGIGTWSDPTQYGLSLALGGGDVTMVDMATAYGMLANLGERVELSPVITVAGKGGMIASIDDAERDSVIDPERAYIISDILSDNQARIAAFGPGSQLEIAGHKVAVKTGTTDEKRDNWTIGYTPEYLVVVWVGNNDHSPMNPYLTSGVTGAAPIWHRMMSYLLETRGNGMQRWYSPPARIVQRSCMGRNEIFVAGTQDTAVCTRLRPSTTPPESR